MPSKEAAWQHNRGGSITNISGIILRYKKYIALLACMEMKHACVRCAAIVINGRPGIVLYGDIFEAKNVRLQAWYQ